ncbi:hypothetical protein [Actinomadura gamaensis]|uniref:Uncharacterized protein n=1 Tax=Actinomadura gamaensis TaxID=1763541 RepID=A0ABV9UBH0_9ACTN
MPTAVWNYAELLAEQERYSEIGELMDKARELELDTDVMAHLIALANGLA